MAIWNLRRTLLLAAAVALTALVAAGCGGDDNGSGPTGVADGSDPAIPAGAPLVDQDNLKFIPTELTVKAGEKVYFKNSETALHTVTINGVDESGNMKKNDIFVWEFPAAGEYKITCEYHPQMKATITVTE
jgi:plastocyanin